MGATTAGGTTAVVTMIATAAAETVAGALGQGLGTAGLDPSAVVPGTDLTYMEAAVFQASFTEGATNAFLVGSVMMLGASLVVWLLLNVKHDELATDGPEGAPAHLG